MHKAHIYRVSNGKVSYVDTTDWNGFSVRDIEAYIRDLYLTDSGDDETYFATDSASGKIQARYRIEQAKTLKRFFP